MILGESSGWLFEGTIQRHGDPSWPHGWPMGTGQGYQITGGGPNADARPFNLTSIRYPIGTRNYLLNGVFDNHGANNPLQSEHPGGTSVQTAEVHAGRSYQSHFGSRLHFGLGSHARVDRIEIRWLGGGREIIENVPADQRLIVAEGRGGAVATAAKTLTSLQFTLWHVFLRRAWPATVYSCLACLVISLPIREGGLWNRPGLRSSGRSHLDFVVIVWSRVACDAREASVPSLCRSNNPNLFAAAASPAIPVSSNRIIQTRNDIAPTIGRVRLQEEVDVLVFWDQLEPAFRLFHV